MLTVDYREHALREALCVEHTVTALPVGDVVCRYDDGSGWIAERKTSLDLARSVNRLNLSMRSGVVYRVSLSGCSVCTEVIDGRWSEQLHRLHAAGFPIFVIIEGDLSDTSLGYNALLSACLNVELRKGSHLIRSCNVEDRQKLNVV